MIMRKGVLSGRFAIFLSVGEVEDAGGFLGTAGLKASAHRLSGARAKRYTPRAVHTQTARDGLTGDGLARGPTLGPIFLFGVTPCATVKLSITICPSSPVAWPNSARKRTGERTRTPTPPPTLHPPTHPGTRPRIPPPSFIHSEHPAHTPRPRPHISSSCLVSREVFNSNTPMPCSRC